MPNLDLNIDEILTTYVLIQDPVTMVWYYNDGGADTVPLKEHRVTTDRNSIKKTGKKLKSCRPPPSYEWFKQKPQLGPLEAFNPGYRPEGTKPFKERVKDWRKRRQLSVQAEIFRRKEELRIPKGWVSVKMPTGKYVLEESADSKHPDLIKRYSWVPEYVQRLRPSDRKWTRHNPRQPVNALVNDLDYYKQQTWTWGNHYLSVSDVPVWTDGPYGTGVIDGPIWLVDITKYADCPPPPAFTISADTGPILAYWAPTIEGLRKVALRRHYAKLKNQKVDLATELSQGMLTINMIGDIAKRIALTLLNLKKGNLVAASKSLFPTSVKQFSSDYLMWQYGIKPLIGDLKGAAEHLAEYIQRAAPVKSNGHCKKIDHQFYSVTKPDGWVSNVTIDTEIRVKYGTSFSIDDKLTRQASQLGFTNPAAVIWELIPFSFVADWFLPIGDWIGNLSALKGLSVKETYMTTFIKQTWTEVLYRMPTYGIKTWVDINGRTMYSRTQHGMASYLQRTGEVIICKRKVIPLPDVPTPQFKNPASPQHIKNALALFAQLVSK